MSRYVALLRAVNVGGTGKLPMADLKTMCIEAGFQSVETYIASGNVVFDSKESASAVKTELERRLAIYAGKPVGVIVRSLREMQAILDCNPFRDQPRNQTVAIFLDEKPSPDATKEVRGQLDEQLAIGIREIYVYYPNGIGHSKMKLDAAKHGTGRNINTIAKLVEMLQK
jgi:uncharacterized protein (DUF1697 family)